MGVLDQLEAVPIPGHHDDVAVSVARLGGEGGEHIVRLEAHLAEHGMARESRTFRIISNWGGRSSGVAARPPL